MKLEKALTGRRTVRRFKQIEVPKKDLTYMVDMARRSACTANSQHLRYLVVTDPALVKGLFDLTAWAAYITPRRTPVWGENSPTAFIAVSSPRAGASQEVNAGAALQVMTLAAYGIGLGTCWMGAFRREEAAKLLLVPNDRELLYLLAVGFPDETPVSEDIKAGDSVKYYLDDNDQLHVPKLRTEDLIEWH